MTRGGAGDEAEVAASYRREEVLAHVAAFCHQMENAYSAADLVVARSGAASLAEISHFAAENHQQLNAEIFARAGAAALLKETETTGETLAAAISRLAGDRQALQTMASCSKSLAPSDAAVCVADTIEHFK